MRASLRGTLAEPLPGGWVAAPRNIPGKSAWLLLPLRRALRGAEALPGVGGAPKAKFGEPKRAGGGSLAVEAERKRGGGVLGGPCGMVPLLCVCCLLCPGWFSLCQAARLPQGALRSHLEGFLLLEFAEG